MTRTEQEFFTAYVQTALWSSTTGDDIGTPLDQDYDESDIAETTLEAMRDDCISFLNDNFDAITCDDAPTSCDGSSNIAMAGHDFWLTRNGHGAGFWDGDWPEPQSTMLDNAANECGEFDIYIGDDGKIWHL